MSGEFGAIERIVSRFGTPPPGEVWAGDDAAVIGPPPGKLLLAIDPMVEGVHFDFDLCSPEDVGWKALARNVSDMAAMGGRPWRAVCSVVGPPDSPLDGLAAGMAEAAKTFECPIVGGDLAGGPRLVVTVAVTGGAARPVLRSGAAPGDVIFVTHPLGAGAAGFNRLRAGERNGPCQDWYQRPWPGVDAGLAAAAAGATAMIDVSDGLAAELDHVAKASGVGFVLDHVPVAAGASLDEALHGGDDYALVICAPRGQAVVDGFAAAGLDPPVLVGRCTADPAERRFGTDRLPPVGWQHDWR